MMDELWRRDEVQSPCVKTCVVHPAERICIGCLRTIDEITHWTRLSVEQRQTILAELPSRAPSLSKRRGGRAARTGT